MEFPVSRHNGSATKAATSSRLSAAQRARVAIGDIAQMAKLATCSALAERKQIESMSATARAAMSGVPLVYNGWSAVRRNNK